jgi:protein-S-isoprenylcysteine O-methyltransferase Ste14
LIDAQDFSPTRCFSSSLSVQGRPPAGKLFHQVGIAFAVWARIRLGADWSCTVATREGSRLVRSGLHALVRHPIYTGILLGFIGTALAIGELRGLLAVALVTTACFRRIRIEERWLLEEFGAECEQYRREVKGLIPSLV